MLLIKMYMPAIMNWEAGISGKLDRKRGELAGQGHSGKAMGLHHCNTHTGGADVALAFQKEFLLNQIILG